MWIEPALQGCWKDLLGNMHFTLQVESAEEETFFERAFSLVERRSLRANAAYRILMQAEGKCILFAEAGTKETALEVWEWIERTMMPKVAEFYSERAHEEPEKEGEIWAFLVKHLPERHLPQEWPEKADNSLQGYSQGLLYGKELKDFQGAFNIYHSVEPVFKCNLECSGPFLEVKAQGKFLIFSSFWCFYSVEKQISILFPFSQMASCVNKEGEIAISPFCAPTHHFLLGINDAEIQKSIFFLLPVLQSEDPSPSKDCTWPALLKSGILIKTPAIYTAFTRRGIPSPMRQIIWPKLAALAHIKGAVNAQEYTLLQAQIIDSPAGAPFKEIERDLKRSLPAHSAFKSSEGIDSLRRVLQAFAHSHPGLGYTQGMNIVAATLLLHLEEHTVYNLLIMIFTQMLPDHCSRTLAGPLRNQKIFQVLLSRSMPQIARRLHRLNVEVSMLTFSWFVCLFTSVLPIGESCRFVDCFLWRGKVFLFEVALAVFKLNYQRLIEARDDDSIIAIVKQTFQRPQVFEDLLEVSEGFPGIAATIEQLEREIKI